MDKYEKLYNEALERARKAYNAIPPESRGARKIIEDVFPELRESEDERIRKEIIEFVDTTTLSTDERHHRWIAYLEKQKKQKPAEWSKEDEMYLSQAIETLEHENYSILADKLKSLRPVKQEWSEEDDQLIGFIFDLLNDLFWRKDWAMSKEECLERLKSLRPQYHKEIYHAAKHDLAIKFMNYLDETRPEGKMSLSNAECEDIDKAFKENDWAKILIYAVKYGK